MDAAQVNRKQAILLNLRQQVSELYSLFQDEQQAKERKWNEEQPMLDAFISALTQTRELLRKEQKDITDQLASLRQKWEKESSKYKKTDRAELTDENVEVDDLQKKLIDLNNRELDVKFELEKLKQQFEGALKEDEREIYETKLVVLQDTRRILLEEINLLRGEIFRRETSMKYESECKTAESSGWEDLGRLEEQLARLDAKIDRAKQSLYFPAAKGYRFSGGSSGVYFAAKELYISELSGSFQLRCEPVDKPDGTSVVQLFVSLAGASIAPLSESPVVLSHRRSCSLDAHHSDPSPQSNGSTASPLPRALSDLTSNRNPSRPSPTKSASSHDLVPLQGCDDDASSGDRNYGIVPPPSLSLSPTRPGEDGNNGGRTYRTHMTSIMDTLGKNKDRLKEAINSTIQTPGRESYDGASIPGKSSTTPASSPSIKPPHLNLPKLQTHLLAQPDASSARGKFMGFAKKMSQSVVAKSQTLGEKVAAKSQTISQSLGEKVAATSHTLQEKMAVQKQTLGEKMAPVVARGHNISEKMTERVGHALAARKGMGSDLQRQSLSSDRYALDDFQAAPLTAGLSAGSMTARSRTAMDDSKQLESSQSVSHHGTSGELLDVDLLDSPTRIHPPLQRSNTPDGCGSLPPGLAPEDGVSISGRDDYSEVASSMDTFTGLHPGGTNSTGDISHRGLRPLPDEVFERASGTGLGVSELAEVMSTGGRSDDGFENIPLSAELGGSPTARHSPVARNSPLSVVTPKNTTAPGVPNGESHIVEAETESEKGDTGEKGSIPAVWAEESQPRNRKGVHVTLLSENMEVVGEKGSKMPKISTKELALEVEVTLQATFEYSSLMGWQAVGTVVCEIVHLDRKVVGNNIPLPRTLIKTILNYLLPKALTKAFLANLPVELGKYILSSKDQWNFGGELRIMGPSLSTFTVDLDAGMSPPPEPSKSTASMFTRSSGVTSSQHTASLIQARRAQQLLGLSPAQVAALSELFGSRSLGLFMDRSQALSVMELCRFYSLYHRSSAWHPLCNMINRAVQGIMDANGTVDKDFSFLAFMEQHVSRQVKNPVRINMAVQRLDFGIDVDAAVDTLRELFERLARDFHKNAQKSQKHMIMQQPLDVQLETLHKWHQATLKLVRTFKVRFKSASASVSASADKELFQINLNKLHYAGPLRLQVPLNLSPDSSSGNSFMVEVRLPRAVSPGTKSGLAKVVQIIKELANSVLEGADQLGEVNGKSTGTEEMRSIIKDWQERLAEASSPRTPRRDNDPFKDVLHAPPSLATPVLGRIFIKRLHAGLQLDEKRITELLSEGILGSNNAGSVGGLLKCFGDLFSASVDTQQLSEGEGEEGGPPRVMLTLQSNDVTVVRADVDSLQIRSGISPKTATRLAQVLVMALAHQFWKLSPKRVHLLNRIFQHTHEYLSKDVLNCFMSLSMSAQVHDNKIHVLVKGDPAGSQAGRQEASQQQLQYPVHFVNDMNLGTVMESIKMLVWEQ